MSPRIPVQVPFRPAALLAALLVVGPGMLVAAAAAGERAAGERAAGVRPEGETPARGGTAGIVAPDTVSASPTTPWAIPLLRPARVEVRPPSAPAGGTDELPPLVRLIVADAPTPGGVPGPPAATPAFRAPVPLSAGEVEAVLAPLPPLPGRGPSSDEGTADGSAGEPTAERAGAGAARNPASVEPARVLGVFPSGDADVAPDVTVVFSHAVAPLGAVGEATSVPFRWEPEVAGSWHWLDATTARFLPRGGRLPGGQSYRLQVDAGFGGPAAEGLSVPLTHEAHIRIRGPLALGGSGAGMILPTTPVMVLGFDQEVDPAEVATHASFRVLGGSPDPGPAALQAAEVVPAVARTLDDAPEQERDAVRSGRYAGAAALSPARPLPPGTWIRLELDAELNSTEGPLATGRRQELTFRTADTFRLVSAPCGSGEPACTPGAVHSLGFSNPVDPSQPLEERIQVTPEVPGLQFRSQNVGTVALYGPFEPWTSYDVRVDGDLVDVFGTPLGEEQKLTLHFGRASARLAIRGAPFVSLDPTGNQELEIPVRGLDRMEVRILEADPRRWEEWLPGSPGSRFSLEARAEGLRELERFDLEPDDGGEGFSFLQVQLGRALEEAGGQVVVLINGFRERDTDEVAPPGTGMGTHTGAGTEPRLEATVGAWVQLPSTRIQLVADAEQLAVVVRALDGSPAEGVRLTLPQAGVEASTDARGIASIPLSSVQEGATVLLAERDGRITLVPSSPGMRPYPSWRGEEGLPGPAWAATLDRPLYRPGEPLAVQGWVQDVVQGEARDLAAPERIRAIRYELLVPTGAGGRTRTVQTGEVEVSPTGGFHALLDLPGDMEPGYGNVRLTALAREISGNDEPAQLPSGPAWTHDLGFRSADFRRPDYAVSVALPPEVLFQDEPFQVTAEARYFDGPGLPGSEVRWTLSASRSSYVPPGWSSRVAAAGSEGGTVSAVGAPWRFGPGPRSPLSDFRSRSSAPVEHEARTSPEGRHHLEVTARAMREPFPQTLRTSVTVQDLNRQAGSASANAVLLPGQAVPGLRVLPLSPRPSGRVLAGDSVEVQVLVLDAEGALVPPDRHGRPEVRMERLAEVPDSERYSVRWEVALASPVNCTPSDVPTPEGSAHGHSVQGYRCRAQVPEAGEWLASVEVQDDRGRRSRAEANVTVFGAGTHAGVFRQFGGLSGFGEYGISGETLEVELEGGTGPDEELMPGDTVTLRIRAPFAGGLGMAVLDHGGIRRVLAVDMQPGETEARIRFPVEGAPGPRAAEVLIESPAGDRGASGRVGFNVANDARRLTLVVQAPEERVEPGSSVPVMVSVMSGDGGPVPGAEVTIWLVDEAALFAAGGAEGAFTSQTLDPWNSLYVARGGIRARGGLWPHTLRERREPGEGELQVRVLDAFTGNAASGTLEVTGSDGLVRSLRPDPNGEFHVPDLPPGDVRVRFVLPGNETGLDRSVVRDGHEGVDLGTLLVRPRVPPQSTGAAAMLMRARGPDAPVLPFGEASLSLQEIVISATTFDGIETPPPPDDGVTSGYLRQDFTPLAGMAPRVVTDEDGVARTTFRLPDTLTRYRILAVARAAGAGSADPASAATAGPSVGAGEGLVVAGRDLVVRATPPRFLRAGDLGEVSLLVENGGDVDQEVEVALRASGLTLEGTGGVRLDVPAGGRREVRMPAWASVPGTGVIQVRAVSGAMSDAVGVHVPVEVPAAPERMAFRTLLDPGTSRTVSLATETELDPRWGGLEVMVSSSLIGDLGSELLALSGTKLPWAGLRIARVRGMAALHRALERDPALGASLDSAALVTLRRTVDEDMAALGQALRSVQAVGGSSPSIGGLAAAAHALGTWSIYEVLEASQALEEALQAGLGSRTQEPGSPRPPLPIEPAVLRILLADFERAPGPGSRAGAAPRAGADRQLATHDLAALWTLHRAGHGLRSFRPPLQMAVAGLETEGMRPLWLARVATMVAAAEEENGASRIPVGAHLRFLEALENRARITSGGVTFRRGAPFPVAAAAGVEHPFHFSATNPAEDAEILLALVEVAPDHPLLPGLVASVAATEHLLEDDRSAASGPGTPWGPGVAGRALAALEAWAQVHARAPANAEVRLALPGTSPSESVAEEPLRVGSGEPVQRRWLPMARLLEVGAGTGAEGARLALSLVLESHALSPNAGWREGGSDGTGGGFEGGGSGPGPAAVSARVLLTWTAADPFQPAVMRGFVVRRTFEGVDDADDVRRDEDGTWRVRAGARVRVVHELLLPERRMDVRLEDPFPAGFEPVQGTSGNEGAGRAPTVAGAELLLDARWGLGDGFNVLLAFEGIPWYRDLLFSRDQAVAWAPSLPPGTYRGSWVARATLPGDYIVPGVRAFEAGRPDIMGRSEAHRVVIEER